MYITKPSPQDFAVLADIFNQAIIPFYDIYTAEEKQNFDLQESADSIAELAQSRHIIAVKDIDDTLVGFAAYRKKNDNVVWISSLYVLPAHQKNGVGLLLLNAIEQHAKNEKCKIVALETHEKAVWAINFYTRMHYTIINDMFANAEYQGVLERPPVNSRPVLAKII